jgi:hypothetical protein
MEELMVSYFYLQKFIFTIMCDYVKIVSIFIYFWFILLFNT